MATDDAMLHVIRRDLSGGSNTRQHATQIAENQATVLYNVDIGIPGETTKRKGLSLIQSLASYAGTGLFGFEPIGGTNTLIGTWGNQIRGYTGTGTFTSLGSVAAPTADYNFKILKIGQSGAGDVALLSNGYDYPLIYNNASTGSFSVINTSNASVHGIPKTKALDYWRNRVWALYNSMLYYSDAYPSDYNIAFSLSNSFRFPVGTEKAVVGLRDAGIVAFGSDQIWSINPSSTPVATDKSEKILDIGCAAGDTVVQVADDILFLARDGVRGLFRTQQDKLQTGSAYPLSFPLKDEFENINWNQINKACAIFFDNKYFLALPTGNSTYNDQVWVYYPATKGWMVITGWNVAGFATMTVNGEERLYVIDSINAKVYRAWYGYDDNGTAINYQEEGRYEDLGYPLSKKVGGEVRVKFMTAGNYDVTVYAAIDDGGYAMLGTVNLSGSAPQLPIALPFELAEETQSTQVFHLDGLGAWYRIKLKIQHNAINSDEIKCLERAIMSFKEEYQPENI